MSKKAKPVPEGYHSATPYLIVRDAARAIDFYRKAFGATELVRMPGPDGRLMHAEMRIGDSVIMLSDEFPERGALSPQSLGGAGVGIFLYLDDVDAHFEQAVSAGAKVLVPVEDMFWGDRWGQIEDPFAHRWQLATHKEDLSGEEIGRRAAQAFG
ncbi:MAG: glyoxalase [Acidobacteria bacterium]|nr:MAG: glyoxalase [Acidobacteriota bacterium]